MISLTFDITPQKTIQVTMIMVYSFWFLGYHKELESAFCFLSAPGYPVGLDHGDNGKNTTVTMTWILPIYLAQFLVDKFDTGSTAHVLSHLKTYLNTKE